MTQPATAAISAYRSAAARPVDPGLGDGVRRADPEGFSDMVRQASQDAVETMRAGETATMKSVIGEAGLLDVVTAVNDAHVTLQTVVAVRDRFVSAYQEILRMPI